AWWEDRGGRAGGEREGGGEGWGEGESERERERDRKGGRERNSFLSCADIVQSVCENTAIGLLHCMYSRTSVRCEHTNTHTHTQHTHLKRVCRQSGVVLGI